MAQQLVEDGFLDGILVILGLQRHKFKTLPNMMDGGMAADFPLFSLFLSGTNGHYSIKPFMWQGKTQFLRPSRLP